PSGTLDDASVSRLLAPLARPVASVGVQVTPRPARRPGPEFRHRRPPRRASTRDPTLPVTEPGPRAPAASAPPPPGSRRWSSRRAASGRRDGRRGRRGRAAAPCAGPPARPPPAPPPRAAPPAADG